MQSHPLHVLSPTAILLPPRPPTWHTACCLPFPLPLRKPLAQPSAQAMSMSSFTLRAGAKANGGGGGVSRADPGPALVAQPRLKKQASGKEAAGQGCIAPQSACQ